MSRRDRDEWWRDIADRQHNVVFPDTAKNEARLWRNLLTKPWNSVVIAGIGLVCLTILGAFASFVSINLRVQDNGTLVQRILDAFGTWIILLAIAAVLLLIGLAVSRRRANRGNTQRR